MNNRTTEIRDVVKNIEAVNLSDYNQLKDDALYLIKANYEYYKSIIRSSNDKRNRVNNCYEYYKQKLSHLEEKAEIDIRNIHREFISTLTNKQLFNEMHQRMALSKDIFSNTNETLTPKNLVEQVFKIYDYEKFKSNILDMRLIIFKKRINDEVINIFNTRVIESLKFYDLCRSIY
ncbi:hypothetical protein HCN44_008232 [Aphidius gifuensis]|uniref:Uncharacterized protein n=1 Tax=Aphidius gifuensis TaxID=684658 RepID=A0A834XNB1_APHGI|nr:hypothetical protein HCN44_008232 [Aphidius gifuensis]